MDLAMSIGLGGLKLVWWLCKIACIVTYAITCYALRLVRRFFKIMFCTIAFGIFLANPAAGLFLFFIVWVFTD